MDEDDDLDRLLDEVEEMFSRNISVATSSRVSSSEGPRKQSASQTEGPASSVAEDVDALLEELLEEDPGDPPRPKTEPRPSGTGAEKKLPSASGGRKCCPVFIGGTSVTNGVGTTTSKRSCDQLRCTSCDFRVLMFDDCEWDQTCDYLFLRINMPDSQKLRARLRSRRGCRAYACQCSWFSASGATDLRNRPRLTWVCGKHQD